MARSTIILGVIAAALLAFILLHERDMLSSAEIEQRKNRVLTTFVRDRVTRVEIVRKGKSVVLERAPDPALEDALGPWKQSAPMQVAVDQEAIDVLLGELEWLQPRRVIENLSAEDQKRFGFDKPRIEVRYAIGKQRGVLLVGHDEPTGLGLYARGDDTDVAYIVGKDLFEALDHDGGHFHTKELHRGVFVFSASALTVKTAAGEGRGEWRDGSWWMSAPYKALLSAAEVEGVIKAFDQLRAKRFIASKIVGPETYGLNAPNTVLTVERRRATATNKELATPVTLRVGAACGERANETFVQVDQGPVMCAADEDLAKLTRPVEALVDRSPFPLEPDGVVEIRLEVAGRAIVLTKKEERWQLQRTGTGSASAKAIDADREAVTEWIKALRGLSFTARRSVATPPAGAEVVALTLKPSNESPGIKVQVRVAEDGAVFVLRGDEGAWLQFEPSARDLMSPFAARFRSLALVQEADVQLESVEVTRSGTTERVVRSGERWSLEAPVRADADPIVLADVAHLLSGLSAVRFAADTATAEHGLGAGATRVVFKLGSNARTLLLGASAADGVFAQLAGDAAVFVVPTRVTETLTQGFLAKTALATPIERMRAVTLEGAGQAVRLRRNGERFVVEGSAVDATVVTATIDRLARLRAEAMVHYGPAQADKGFGKPRLRVTIETTDANGQAQQHELLLGAAIGTPEALRVYARRSDLEATLTVTASTLDRLMEALAK